MSPDSPNILYLPPEILQQTFGYLDREAWHNITLVHRQLTPSALVLLYQEPQFFSSYRFAQFVTTVATSADHAALVRDLTLKKDSANLVDLCGIFDEMLAGWREWKYHGSRVWGPLPAPAGRTWTHPLAALFSRREDKAKSTIPIGALIQVLTACVNLRCVKGPFFNFLYSKVDNFFHAAENSASEACSFPPTGRSSTPSRRTQSRTGSSSRMCLEPRGYTIRTTAAFRWTPACGRSTSCSILKPCT